MAPIALQMKLVAGCSAKQNFVGGARPQLKAVQPRVARHVMYAAKVADLEEVVKAGK